MTWIFIWNTAPTKIFVWWQQASKVFVWDTQVRPTWPAPVQERPDLTSFSLTAQVNTGLGWTHGMCCSEDWKNIYISDANWPVKQYICSDWTLSTFPSNYSYAKSWIKTRWMYIKSDWSALYSCVDWSPYTYTAEMSTSYRIDTATVTTENLDSNTKPVWCAWSTDWVYFYCGYWDNSNVPIYQYYCSTPRDLSTASSIRTLNLYPIMTMNTYDIRFSPTGLKMYVWLRPYAIQDSGGIYQFNLSTAWDISTATYYTYMSFPTPSGSGYYKWDWTTFDFCNNWTRIFAHRVNCQGTTNTFIFQYDAS